jgi:hypothetical protein
MVRSFEFCCVDLSLVKYVDQKKMLFIDGTETNLSAQPGHYVDVMEAFKAGGLVPSHEAPQSSREPHE